MEEKKTLKGFTLVELVIVLAIFSIILALVMSFIDPVSNLMKNTSIRERTAAHTNNISEYIDNSLHYAKFMFVYEGGSLFQYDDRTAAATEEEAAADIVKCNLAGAVDKNKDFISGKVRILEFDNSADGQIYESVYNFTTGYTDALNNKIPVPKITEVSPRTPVLNAEYFENYNYHYTIGYYDFKTYESTPGINGRSGTHNSRLIQKIDTSGTPMEAAIDNFPINIIAYNKDADSRFTDYEKDADGNPVMTSPFTAFRSPSHMSTVSMALINAINVGRSDSVNYYRYDTTDNKFKAIPGSDFVTFNKDKYNGTSTDFDSFYVAYILPYEINDSVMDLG